MSMRGRMARLLSLATVIAGCSSGAAPSPTPSSAPSAAIAPVPQPSPTAAPPVAASAAMVNGGSTWYLLPDGLSQGGIRINVEFPDGDMSGGRPRARLRSTGRSVDLVPSAPPAPPGVSGPAPHWIGTISLDGAKPGADAYEVVVRVRDGSDVVAARREIQLSQPEYVVWTLDFEGDAASDDALANTAAIADGRGVPMTVMWNPRVWTTTEVAPARASTMQAWTMSRAATGDEVALHIHAWTDFVRAAGVTPRTAPNWSGRSDGYDVPLTAFDERETRALIDKALALMAAHGMPKPSTFRAGGLFANAANLRAIAAAGFAVDMSATPAGGFGRLPLPWTLAKDAQPYRPSRDDANAPGDLPLLEVPNIAGNTFALDVRTIRSVIAADLAMLAPAGQVARERRALTLVSHPGTIDATERAAIQSLFDALLPYRFDKDSGPLRFVTAAQLAKAFK